MKITNKINTEIKKSSAQPRSLDLFMVYSFQWNLSIADNGAALGDIATLPVGFALGIDAGDFAGTADAIFRIGHKSLFGVDIAAFAADKQRLSAGYFFYQSELEF